MHRSLPFLSLLVPLLLTGCAKTEPVSFEGLHLLADAQVTVRKASRNHAEAHVDILVHVVNAGTAPCTSTSVELIWPEQTEHRLKRGSWVGLHGPFKPGDRGAYSADMQLSAEDISPGQLESWLQAMQIEIWCWGTDYRNRVIPQVSPPE